MVSLFFLFVNMEQNHNTRMYNFKRPAQNSSIPFLFIIFMCPHRILSEQVDVAMWHLSFNLISTWRQATNVSSLTPWFQCLLTLVIKSVVTACLLKTTKSGHFKKKGFFSSYNSINLPKAWHLLVILLLPIKELWLRKPVSLNNLHYMYEDNRKIKLFHKFGGI